MKRTLVLFLLIAACQKREVPQLSKPDEPRQEAHLDQYFVDQTQSYNSLNTNDRFQDLKKNKKESCKSPEELKKQLRESGAQAFQLQGGATTGCEIQ